MSNKTIKVIVADDSGFARLLISNILSANSEIEVVATANDGREAANKVAKLKPDVLVLDMTMGQYDGLYAVKEIMQHNPVPILILSALGNTDMAPILEALKLGAFDYLNKPAKNQSKLRDLDYDLIKKVKVAARADVKVLLRQKSGTINSNQHTFARRLNFDVIVVGSSTGGPSALEKLITNLPGNMAVPIVIAQHMPASFVESFTKRLNNLTPLEVIVGKPSMQLQPGRVIIAPGTHNMIVKKEGAIATVDFTEEKFKEFNNPSVDALMLSVAKTYKSKTIGVILTGMGRDGAIGMKSIFDYGGYTVAQNKETCVVYGMPREAVEKGGVKHQVSIHEMGGFLVSCLS